MKFKWFEQSFLFVFILACSINCYSHDSLFSFHLTSLEKPASAGKSHLINETDTELQIDFNDCQYDYDSKQSKFFNIKCSSSVVKCKPHQKAVFELKQDVVMTPDVTHSHNIFIKKISSDTKSQYFISDPMDMMSYDRYKNDGSRRGITRAAFYCRFYDLMDIHIYEVDEGFLCR